MNQILSVDASRDNKRRSKTREPRKASTKSVVMFFCIILIIFAITLIGVGIYSISKKDKNKAVTPNIVEEQKPRIDIAQNGSRLEVEISSEDTISKIEYNWNDGDIQSAETNGTTRVRIEIAVPNGTNTLNIVATDTSGSVSEYSHEYEATYPNATLEFDEATNKLKIVCTESAKISHITYYYDSEQEQTVQVNDISAQIEIPINQGKHDLTLKVVYEDGIEKQMTKQVYFPVVERVQVTEDMNSFFIKASDERGITKIIINFNGVESEEAVNNTAFEKILKLQNGENRLILTVYNADGVSTTTKTKWVK